MAKVLVTCVGSGVGQSVIDSLNLTGRHFIVGCDSNRNVYAYSHCNDFHVAPRIYSDNYINYLLNLAIENKIEIIIPGHDYELLLLSKNIQEFHNNGIEVIVSKTDIISVSRNKYEWYLYFKKIGCSIVPTFKVSEFKNNPDSALFPAIVKPSAGSGSQGIIILNSISELSLANDSDIIQPYLFPKKDDPNYERISEVVEKGRFIQMSEISIQLIFSKESTFDGIFISKNSLKSGVPIFIDPINPEEFEYINEIMKFVPVCIEKKVVGPVNIQGRITEKGLIFFEMNMRFTGITGNRAQLGFNEVEYLVNNFLGLSGKLKGFSKNKLGVRQVACTTIPRLNESGKVDTLTVWGGDSSPSRDFIYKVFELKSFNNINVVICDRNNYSNYWKKYEDEGVKIFLENDEFLETIYCQSDILVNFTNAIDFKNKEELYNSIIFQFGQLRKVINANIPLIINVSNANTRTGYNSDIKSKHIFSFQSDFVKKFIETVGNSNPASRIITLDSSVGDNTLENILQEIHGFYQSIN